MVPARLTVRNFLCYRDCPTIELAHVRVACLTGDNGHGKSALLDAITWALWGKARSNRDGDLISLGQTQMEVEFEFFVGEARHRVVRRCQRTGARGSTHTTLEFQVHDGAAWKTLSGSSQHETQGRVLDVLKLSYETFVNSAFLMQGKADAFTLKSAGERKQVLADILNLGQYDVFEDRAKERRNERQRIAAMLDQQTHDAEVELVKLPRHRAERDETAAELAAQETEHETAAALRDALRRSVDEIASLRRELAGAEARRREAADLLARAEGQVHSRRAEIARYEAVVARGAAIRDGHARLVAAREALAQLTTEDDSLRRRLADAERARDDAAGGLAGAEQRVAAQRATIDRHAPLVEQGEAIRAGFSRLKVARTALEEQGRRMERKATLDGRLTRLAAAVSRSETELRTDLRLRRDEMDRLATQAATVDALVRERAEAERGQAALDALDKRLGSLRAEETELRAEAQALASRNTLLRAEMDEFRRKFDELKAALEQGAADCPLCRTPLGHDGLRRIDESYEAEGKAKADEFRRNRGRIQELEATAQASGEEARRLEAELSRRRGDWASRMDRLARDLEAARKAAADLAPVRAEVERLEAALAAGDFAPTEREQIAALEEALAALGYDAEAHERARREVAELGRYEAQHQQLVQAESALAAARDVLADAEDAARGWRFRRDEAAARVAELTQQLAALPLETARREAENLAGYEAEHQELLAAETRLPVAAGALASEQAAAEGWRRTRDEEDAHVVDLRDRIAGLAAVEEQLAPAEETVRTLADRCGELRRALGAIEQEVERLDDLERRTAASRQRLEDIRRELAIYEQLVKAFGRSGVQAAIIDSALPEVEAVANDLLARMTNNRMHVTLETQRQTLKGTVQETLEIKIADEWGTRNYEMYSGGEAFRIDLALRIALSKLLARRAGAPLPTLVIDEGFGTQDAAGRERLLEAITAIQDDFQCLLLVTHIEELKDMFDTRIEVVKYGDGSVARVVAA